MVSYAFTTTVGMTLLTAFYTDDKRRSRALGTYNAFSCAVGALLSLTAGRLATGSILAAYRLHLVVVLYFVMLVPFVPSFKPAGNGQVVADADVKGPRESLGLQFWLAAVNYAVIYNLAFCFTYYYVSMYISENGLGNEAMSGVVNAFLTCIGFITPLLYGRLAVRLGRCVSAVSYLFSVIGCVLLLRFPSRAAAFIGYGLLGGTGPLLRTDAYAVLPSIVPESRVNDSIAYIGALQNISGCTTGFVMTRCMTTFRIKSFTSFLIIPTVILAASFVISLADTAGNKTVKENCN